MILLLMMLKPAVAYIRLADADTRRPDADTQPKIYEYEVNKGWFWVYGSVDWTEHSYFP